MVKKADVQMGFRIPSELHHKCLLSAESTGVTLASWIRGAMIMRLEQENKKRAPSSTEPTHLYVQLQDGELDLTETLQDMQKRIVNIEERDSAQIEKMFIQTMEQMKNSKDFNDLKKVTELNPDVQEILQNHIKETKKPARKTAPKVVMKPRYLPRKRQCMRWSTSHRAEIIRTIQLSDAQLKQTQTDKSSAQTTKPIIHVDVGPKTQKRVFMQKSNVGE